MLSPWRSSFVSKYVLGDRIGEGGMGVVHRAEQPALARTVAIKLLRSELTRDRRMNARFRAEALAMARLSHPNLVTVIDYGETEEGTPFLVMEYVHGRSLGELVRTGGEISVERAIALTLQVLSGLAAAHAAGVIHADVKSDNVLVWNGHDGRERVKLIDFGLAQGPAVDGEQGRSGEVLGTPEYLAPEVIRGSRPARPADLYGVGIILYELLTGAPPFTGSTPAEIMSRHLEEDLVPMAIRRPDRPILPMLESIVAHALAKSPDHRISDALAFATALELASATCAETERSTRPDRLEGAPAISPPVSPRIAHGSGLESEPLLCAERTLRRDICDAIARGKADAIARGYVELAAMLTVRGQIHAAIHELEEALDLVTEGLGPSAATGKATALVAALLPLYAQINDQRGAYAEAADRWRTLTE